MVADTSSGCRTCGHTFPAVTEEQEKFAGRMSFRFGNTSLSVVELTSHRVMLASLNDLCHLEHSLR